MTKRTANGVFSLFAPTPNARRSKRSNVGGRNVSLGEFSPGVGEGVGDGVGAADDACVRYSQTFTKGAGRSNRESSSISSLRWQILHAVGCLCIVQ